MINFRPFLKVKIYIGKLKASVKRRNNKIL